MRGGELRVHAALLLQEFVALALVVRGGTVLRDRQVKRAARRVAQVPLNMGVGVGVRRRGGGGSGGKNKGGDRRPQRDRRRRTDDGSMG